MIAIVRRKSRRGGVSRFALIQGAACHEARLVAENLYPQQLAE
jgi:hypothetical protein